MRRVIVAVVAVLALLAGGAYYLGHHLSAAVPLVVSSAGPRLVNGLLTSHPIPLSTAGAEQIVVQVTATTGNLSLAHTVATALGASIPARFSVPKSAWASLPAAIKPFIGSAAGLSGTVSGVHVESASGSTASGEATVAGTVTVGGRAYRVTGTVHIANGVITSLSGLRVRS